MSGFYKGQVCLVTGGNSGIGRELVRHLAADGATVIAWGRNQRKGVSLVKELKKSPGAVSFETVDVQNPLQVEHALKQLIEQHQRVDYVFHGVGIILGGEVRDHTIDEVRAIMQTNVLGTAHVNLYVYQQMVKQGSGHLVNIASGAGLFPLPLMGVYSASKFAVYGMGEVLRMEGHQLGVKVSTVAPGLVDTPIYERAMYSRTDKAKTLSSLKKRLYMIQPDQAARVILKGTRRNRAIIHTQLYVRLGWLSYRYFPHVFRFVTRQFMKPFRSRYRNVDGSP
ncbi:MAG TPA: SDR family NAD(P)-dependent oxidoreductase [Candidatus Limnocylindrales bacterium]|nr:SDR family NAD(P)-dependent oxidoreductase [Candidatus Limnocylindrales bacterium]